MGSSTQSPTIAPERPAAKGEIRDLVLQLKELIPQIQEDTMAALGATALCNEILAMEKDFTDRAQNLAGKALSQAAEINGLQHALSRASAGQTTCHDRLLAGRCELAL